MSAISAWSAAPAAGRRRAFFAALTLLVVALLIVGLTQGAYRISLLDVLRGVGAERWLGEVSTPTARFLLHEELLPRSVAAVASGAAFGVAGHVTQLVFRHPLASPDVVGVSMGASSAAAFSIMLAGASGLVVVGWAALGGLAVAAMLAGVAAGACRWGGRPSDAIACGVAVSWALAALVHLVMVQADVYRAKDAMIWLTGSLGAVTREDAALLAVVAVLGCGGVAAGSGLLTSLRFGSAVAAGWGIRPGQATGALMVGAVVLAAGATAVTGPLAGVSLLAPVVARAALGGRPSLWASGLVGVCLVVGADVVTRSVAGGVPAGVFTGMAGGVAVLWLASSGVEEL